MKICGGNDIRVITDRLIYIEESDGSLVYDIDDVLRELKRMFDLAGRRIIVKDENGNYDEIITLDNEFLRFDMLEKSDAMINQIRTLLGDL